MPTVESRDGTIIAFDRVGTGAPLILVDGALGSRSSGTPSQLASHLSSEMTTYTYDRRGRNESGDTKPYAVAREIEDIDALIDDAGGSAFVYGHSSGAALVLEAAAVLGDRIRGIALYEPPYGPRAIMGDGPDDYEPKLNRLISEGKLSESVDLFMSVVGVPPEALEQMHRAPIWGSFVAIAPTLAYDAACMNGGLIPYDRAARINAPALVMSGSASFDFMKPTAEDLARTIPNGRYLELAGQRHDVDPTVLAPILADFLRAAPTRAAR